MMKCRTQFREWTKQLGPPDPRQNLPGQLKGLFYKSKILPLRSIWND